MKEKERGFTIIELLLATAIATLIACAATMGIFQIIKSTERSNEHMTAVRQVQNASYWISRDAQMAESVITDNLSPTDFIFLTWTEREYGDYGSDDTYHSITYFFEELSDEIGKLKRNHWSSAGANAEILVAEYIFYDPGDPVNSSNVSYQDSILAVKLVALFGDAGETREYRISRRQNFNY